MELLSIRPQTSPFRGAPGGRRSAGPGTSPGETLVDSLGMSLCCIPAGEFWMGNHDSRADLAAAFVEYEPERLAALDDERPLHRVRLTRPFGLGTYQVTVGQFRQFVAWSGYRTEAELDGQGGWGFNPATAEFEGRRPEFSWRDPGFDQDDCHPVINVTWNDATAFCQWLSHAEGRRYRLPTEAEWEYACRAGTTSRFHSGDDPESLVRVANCYDARAQRFFPQWSKYAVAASDGFAFTAPVGSFEPNAFGLYDMHGNVWEWCSDWYSDDYYARSPRDDPQGPETGDVRLRRGGSWHSWPLYLRSSYRNWNRPDTRYVLLGFRVALAQP